MATRYEPVISGAEGHLGNIRPGDVDRMQADVDRHGLTHCQALDGKVWKIFPQLNTKSVRLNHAQVGPQRLPFDRVESIGRLIEEEA